MKKIAKIIGVLVFVLPIAFIVSIPIVNNYSAYQIKNRLIRIPLPENTEYVEGISEASKMTGNGNCMQYLGAILIKSKLSIEELNRYYSKYREDQWDCIVEIQKDQLTVTSELTYPSIL